MPRPRSERREQILQTLVVMLEGNASNKITTAKLAEQVGVSEAALYRHFASKTKMFEALIEFAEETLFSRLRRISEETTESLASCEQMLTLLLGFCERNPGIARILHGEALAGEELEVEYISLLAQAQQAVAASSLERVMGFAGNLVAVFPEIVDGIDSDEALRQYANILGTSPDVIISDDELQAKRQARAEEQQQMQAMQQAGQLAQGAKILSETDTQNPNALTDLLGTGASVV